MATTRRIPREEWQEFFDEFTDRHLGADVGGVVTIEAVSMEIGDQVLANNAKALAFSYDPHGRTLEVQLEGEDHLIYEPSEVWVLEGDREDTLATFELVRPDGVKEIVHVRGGGPLRAVEDKGTSRSS